MKDKTVLAIGSHLTWNDLLNALARMPCSRLDEPAQFVFSGPDDDKPEPTMPAIAVAKSKDLFGGQGIRTHYDNQDHQEDFVVLLDDNRYSESGAIAIDVLTGEEVFPPQEGCEA